MRVSVCENKQKGERWRVLSTTRHTEKENVCRFEIGRDKKKCTTVSVSHAKNRREKREREKERKSAQFIVMSYWKFFFLFLFFLL
jgi:hypothetical protein